MTNGSYNPPVSYLSSVETQKQFNAVSKNSPLVWDNFDSPNQILAGRVSPSGQTWAVSGPGVGTIGISGGVVTAGDNVYPSLQYGAQIKYIGGVFSYVPHTGANIADTPQAVLIAQNADLSLGTMLHLQLFWNGWSIQKRIGGGAFVSIGGGVYTLSTDGALYKAAMQISGNTVTVEAPDGQSYAITDSDIGTMSLTAGTWQLQQLASTSALKPRWHSVFIGEKKQSSFSIQDNSTDIKGLTQLRGFGLGRRQSVKYTVTADGWYRIAYNTTFSGYLLHGDIKVSVNGLVDTHWHGTVYTKQSQTPSVITRSMYASNYHMNNVRVGSDAGGTYIDIQIRNAAANGNVVYVYVESEGFMLLNPIPTFNPTTPAATANVTISASAFTGVGNVPLLENNQTWSGVNTFTGTTFFKGGTPLYIDQDTSYTTFRTTAGVTKHDFVSAPNDFQINNYTAAGAIIFRTNSLERGRFASDGSFLVGSTVTDGVNKLQITGAAKISGTLSTQSILASADATYDIGSLTQRYNGVYARAINSGANSFIINTNNIERARFLTSGELGLATTVPTHTLSLGLNSTGIVHYNPGAGLDDGATNWERVRKYWFGNVYNIVTEAGGTGSVRAITISSGSNTISLATGIDFSRVSTSIGTVFNFNTILASSSTSQNTLSVVPTINQSGTGGYSLISGFAYEQSIGSGSKYLLRFGTSSAANGGGTLTEKFSVSNGGSVAAQGNVSGNAGDFPILFDRGSGIEFRLGNNTVTGKMFPTGRWFFGGSPSDDGVSTAFINGVTRIAGTTSLIGGRPGDNTGQLIVGTTGQAGYISFARSSSGTLLGGIGYTTGTSDGDFNITSAGGSGSMRFTTSLGDAMKIYTSGNVAIQTGGTFTDDGVNRLQVTGSAKVGAATYSLIFGSPVISGYGGIWTGGVTPAVNNYAILANNSGNETLINAISGGKIGLRIANGEKVTINSTGIGIETIAPTHSLTLGLGSTGIASYNNAAGLDNGITNWERVRKYWSGNQYIIATEASGTGVQREIVISSGSGLYILAGGIKATFNTSAGGVNLGGNFGGAGSGVANTSTLSASTSVVQNSISAFPTINQSGTSGYSLFTGFAYEQATGSGSKYLLRLGTSSAANGGGTLTDLLAVSNAGNIIFGLSNRGLTNGSIPATNINLGGTLDLRGSSGITYGVNGVIYGQLFSTGRWFFGPSPTDDGVSVANFNGDVKIQAGLTVANNLTAGSFIANRLLLTANNTSAGITLTSPDKFYIPAHTNNDTASSGTTANYVNALIAVPTLTATNATTYTNASNLYISGAPAASTNVTITNPWSLYIAAGDAYFGAHGSFAGSLTVTGNFSNLSGGQTRIFAGASIGTSSFPVASTILDIVSTTKGVRLPVMTTAQKNAIGSPATGLIVFDSDLGKLCIFATTWQTITSA